MSDQRHLSVESQLAAIRAEVTETNRKLDRVIIGTDEQEGLVAKVSRQRDGLASLWRFVGTLTAFVVAMFVYMFRLLAHHE